MNLYGVYDSVSGFYVAWLVERSDGTVVRSLKSRFSDTDFERFDSDFSLFHLAAVDEVSGKISPVEPQRICTFSEVFLNDEKE